MSFRVKGHTLRDTLVVEEAACRQSLPPAETAVGFLKSVLRGTEYDRSRRIIDQVTALGELSVKVEERDRRFRGAEAGAADLLRFFLTTILGEDPAGAERVLSAWRASEPAATRSATSGRSTDRVR